MERISFWKDKSYVALDIETTGLDSTVNEIIELGAVLYSDGKEIESLNLLLKTKNKLPNFIKQLTKITDEELSTKGFEPNKGLKKLLDFIKDYPLVCHNAPFDIGFIQDKLLEHRLPTLNNKVYDTLTLSKIYLPFLNNHKLETVATGFQLEETEYHRATADARITGQIFHKLTDFIIEYIPFELNNTILEISNNLEQGATMPDHIERIIGYQRKYALISNKANDYLKLFASPYAASLGFNKSHNVINSNDYTPYAEFIEDEIEYAETVIAKEVEKEEIEDSFVDECFENEGLFCKHIDEYEYREGQVEMAKGVESAFENKEYLIVEAGTGIGKSLAYLVPALKFAYLNEKRVYVSTNTKNLQEQLFYKDLPVIKNSTHLPFQATMLKGRENYLCLRKWKELSRQYVMLLNPYEIQNYVYLPVWQRYTKTGDISENSSFYRESGSSIRKNYSAIWKRLSSDRHFCFGKNCPDNRNCYYRKVRNAAQASSLIIVNHSLMLTDVINDKFDAEVDNYLIIDEAHNLPDMAPNYLGSSLAYSDFGNLFNQMFHINQRLKLQSGILPTLRADIQKSGLIQEDKKGIFFSDIKGLTELLEDYKLSFFDIFANLGEIVQKQGNYGKLRYKAISNDLGDSLDQMINEMKVLEAKVESLSKFLNRVDRNHLADYDDHQDRLNSVLETAAELTATLTTFKEADFKNHALWANSFTFGDTQNATGILNYAPLDVSDLLNKLLYGAIDTIIFSSATLSLRNNFKYFKQRMGLDVITDKKVQEMIIHSPFNYDLQTRVIATSYLPQPSDKYYLEQSIELLRQSLKLNKGGSLVLFTSYRDLNEVYNSINDDMYQNNILLLAQGKGASRTTTISEFKENGKGVLLGTSSFWEGVDVPGDSLSLLVIFKLPFQVPSEPIVEALHEKLERDGKNSFQFSTLPNAMLKFRQGFGRLIRKQSDKGAVLILDSRLYSKKYGEYFKDIIPTKVIKVESPIEVRNILGEWFTKQGK